MLHRETDERWWGAEPEEEKEYYLFLPKHMESSYLKLTSSFSFLKNFRKYLLLWNVLLLLSHVYLYIWDLNTMICSIFHMTALDKWSQDHPCRFLLKIKHASPSLPCPDLFVCYCLIRTTLWPLAWEMSLLLSVAICQWGIQNWAAPSECSFPAQTPWRDYLLWSHCHIPVISSHTSSQILCLAHSELQH